MAVPLSQDTTLVRRRTYRPIPETPPQQIQGQAFTIHGKATRIGDAYQASRTPDRLHDAAADLCERAILAGDAMTALRAIRMVKRYDSEEDAELAPIPVHAESIRGHTRVIAGLCEQIEQDQRQVTSTARRGERTGR